MKPSKSSPIKKLKPMRMNTSVPMQKSIRFFIKMLPAFFFGETRFYHGEAGLHPEDQRRAHQKPDAENLACHMFVLLSVV